MSREQLIRDEARTATEPFLALLDLLRVNGRLDQADLEIALSSAYMLGLRSRLQHDLAIQEEWAA